MDNDILSYYDMINVKKKKCRDWIENADNDTLSYYHIQLEKPRFHLFGSFP